MWKRFVYLCVSVVFSSLNLYGQSSWMEWEEQMGEEESAVSWEERYEELSELAEHPFNVNTVTKEELQQLPFLSDKIIENLLYYVYKHGPLVSMNELWGVEGMDRQTRLFLEDFLYIGEANRRESFSWKNFWKYHRQEMWIRTDYPLNKKAGYADIPSGQEDKLSSKRYYGDPFYVNMRYRFQYRDKIAVSFAAEKDAGEPFSAVITGRGLIFTVHRCN